MCEIACLVPNFPWRFRRRRGKSASACWSSDGVDSRVGPNPRLSGGGGEEGVKLHPELGGGTDNFPYPLKGKKDAFGSFGRRHHLRISKLQENNVWQTSWKHNDGKLEVAKFKRQINSLILPHTGILFGKIFEKPLRHAPRDSFAVSFPLPLLGRKEGAHYGLWPLV